MTPWHLLSIGRWTLLLFIALGQSRSASAEECSPSPILGGTQTTEISVTMPSDYSETEVFQIYEIGKVFMMKGGGGYQPLVITSVEAPETTVCYQAANKSFAVLLHRGQRTSIKLRGYCLNKHATKVAPQGNQFSDWKVPYNILEEVQTLSDDQHRQEALWNNIAAIMNQYIR
jgi:hypothetical protein